MTTIFRPGQSAEAYHTDRKKLNAEIVNGYIVTSRLRDGRLTKLGLYGILTYKPERPGKETMFPHHKPSTTQRSCGERGRGSVMLKHNLLTAADHEYDRDRAMCNKTDQSARKRALAERGFWPPPLLWISGLTASAKMASPCSIGSCTRRLAAQVASQRNVMWPKTSPAELYIHHGSRDEMPHGIREKYSEELSCGVIFPHRSLRKNSDRRWSCR